MKKIPVCLLLIWAGVAAPHFTIAQNAGDMDVNLGAGLITFDELHGVSSVSCMDIPGAFTGADFVSARYYISDRLAIGGAIGVDDVKGNLTYGFAYFSQTGEAGVAGTYVRNTLTIAPQLTWVYRSGERGILYGAASAGFTFSRIEKAYNTQLYETYQNGVNTGGALPEYLSPVNPLFSNEGHFNGQLTFLGIRTYGKIGWFFELGCGYKGIIHTGASYRIRFRKLSRQSDASFSPYHAQ